MIAVPRLRDEEAYAYATGRIRSRETRLLDRSRLERLVDAQPLSELFRQLSETDYGGPELELPTGLDFVMRREIRATYRLVREVVPDQTVVDFFAIKFDVFDAQSALRDLDGESWHIGPLDRMLTSPTEVDGGPAYLSGLLAEIADIKSLRLPPSAADARLARAASGAMEAIARRSGCELLVELWELFADSATVLAAARARAVGRDPIEVRPQFVPGGLSDRVLSDLVGGRFEDMPAVVHGTRYEAAMKKGVEAFIEERRLDVLERELDNLVMRAARAAKLVAMGPEVAAGYIVAREFEQRNLRLVVLGRQAGLLADQIKQRLRDSYV